MKVMVELSEGAVVRAELGLVDQVVRVPQPPKRRQLSAATIKDLRARLAGLGWYRRQHGTYGASRNGEHWELDAWVSTWKPEEHIMELSLLALIAIMGLGIYLVFSIPTSYLHGYAEWVRGCHGGPRHADVVRCVDGSRWRRVPCVLGPAWSAS